MGRGGQAVIYTVPRIPTFGPSMAAQLGIIARPALPVGSEPRRHVLEDDAEREGQLNRRHQQRDTKGRLIKSDVPSLTESDKGILAILDRPMTTPEVAIALGLTTDRVQRSRVSGRLAKCWQRGHINRKIVNLSTCMAAMYYPIGHEAPGDNYGHQMRSVILAHLTSPMTVQELGEVVPRDNCAPDIHRDRIRYHLCQLIKSGDVTKTKKLAPAGQCGPMRVSAYRRNEK